MELHDCLFEYRFGKKCDFVEEEKNECLQEAPLHVGNAIIRADKWRILGQEVREDHLRVLFAEHFTILPLQCCIVAAVVQMDNMLDQLTFDVLKELVDAVVVVALVELAVGFKAYSWGFAYVDEVHNNDRTRGEPLGEDRERGLLRNLCK